MCESLMQSYFESVKNIIAEECPALQDVRSKDMGERYGDPPGKYFMIRAREDRPKARSGDGITTYVIRSIEDLDGLDDKQMADFAQYTATFLIDNYLDRKNRVDEVTRV